MNETTRQSYDLLFREISRVFSSHTAHGTFEIEEGEKERERKSIKIFFSDIHFDSLRTAANFSPKILYIPSAHPHSTFKNIGAVQILIVHTIDSQRENFEAVCSCSCSCWHTFFIPSLHFLNYSTRTELSERLFFSDSHYIHLCASFGPLPLQTWQRFFYFPPILFRVTAFLQCSILFFFV